MKLLSTHELISLSKVLHHIFKKENFIPSIDSLPKLIRCYKRIEFGSEVYSVHNDSRYGRHSSILANWASDTGDVDTSNGLRPGIVRQILTNSIALTIYVSLAVYHLPELNGTAGSHPKRALYGMA